MGLLYLLFLVLLQGVPVQTQQSGTVVGVLRTADGKPAAGVRVAAVPQSDSVEAAAAGPTLSSIAETDTDGRYKLENIPPGRYYVAAGRLDLPTYYPGTQSMVLGQVLTIRAGATTEGIDFTLQQTSAGRAETTAFNVVLLGMPLNVRVEGGGKLPLSAGGTLTSIHLMPEGGGTALSFPINALQISLSPPLTDYRIAVEGLPDGYRVKSLKFGTTDLPTGVLRLGNMKPGSSAQSLSIVLDSAGPSALPKSGALVTGSVPINPLRPIVLSDVSGTVFDDGTFEFRNVPPGRHVILTKDNAPAKPALGASIVAGSEDLRDVRLEPILALPQNPKGAVTESATALPPRALRLSSIRGRIVDSETGMAVNAGTIFVVGESWAPCEIGLDGKFEFPHLLPGAYELEVHAVGYRTFRHAVELGDEQDVVLELRAD